MNTGPDFVHWLLMSNPIQNKHNYLICSSTWRVLDHVMHIDALLWMSDNLALICRKVTSDNIISTALMIPRMSLYCPILLLLSRTHKLSEVVGWCLSQTCFHILTALRCSGEGRKGKRSREAVKQWNDTTAETGLRGVAHLCVTNGE